MKLFVEPVKVIMGIGKVEEEPEVQVVAEVGVDGDDTKVGPHQNLTKNYYKIKRLFPL